MILNKHFGFTLAEVLITLGIIGIVAAMTIPTLMKNTQDIELKSAWKKVFSEFSQATTNVKNNNGGTFSGLCASSDNHCLRDEYQNYLKYTTKCDSYVDAFGTCFHPLTGSYLDTVKLLDGTSHISRNYYPYFSQMSSGAILPNGTLVLFVYTSSTCTDTTRVEGYTNACGWITVDVNGFKGPNTVGRDIFCMDILEDRITPTGTKDLANTCTPTQDGRGCAAKYLYQ